VLKKRIITASILIPILVLLILYLPTLFIAVIAGAFFMVAIWEWTRLSGFISIKGRLFAFFMILLSVFELLGIFYAIKYGVGENNTDSIKSLSFVVLGFWILALLSVMSFPKFSKILARPSVALLIGSLVLIPSYGALVFLHYKNPQLLLYVLVLVWVADIGAYFTGKKWGKHKLAVNVSPGKTWEGAMGALIASLIASVIGFKVLHVEMSLYFWIGLSLITVVFSIVGDLLESVYKRLQNLKDSGSIFPGHGGMLDRIDSLTAALPIFVLALIV